MTLHGDRLTVRVGDQTATRSVEKLGRLSVKPGLIWATIQISLGSGSPLTLGGISNAAARHLAAAVEAAMAALAHRRLVAQSLQEFGSRLQDVKAWVRRTHEACQVQLRRRGWLTDDFKARITVTKPSGLEQLLSVPEVQQHLEGLDSGTREAVLFWRRSFAEVADDFNRRHLRAELTASRHFLETVEKSPLTPEQAEAVICFDSRVLLIASAGSGKTSTMVAKAGYALHRGYVDPDRVLMLAFNNDAAAELRERVRRRLGPLGLPAGKITAKTFHAFGLEVVGEATGKKPSVAPWVESGRDAEVLLEIVDALKSSDPLFRVTWDLFRLVFGQDLPEFGAEERDTDAWDKASGREGFRTLQGEIVRSRGEQIIADWFFYNGVAYEYEAPYRVDTADAQHRQYRPDFYLPGPDVYLEHWALDARGEPPPEFTGYKEGMAWKRSVHQANGTTLLETTMAHLWSGRAFSYLEKQLRALGVELDPNPDRDVPGRPPIDTPRLLQTVRSMLTHAKSNRLDVAELRRRLDQGLAGHFRFRHEMFLNLFERVLDGWEARLRAAGCIDFDDMLTMAADCIEQGRWTSQYELVMVDEFQDASQARARLIAGLVKEPGRLLFAVGDDWQSINRFAGADLGVMTDFEARFGRAVTLRLETTFRCPQSLCDISSRFVQKNPRQLRKTVRSAGTDVESPLAIVRVANERSIRSAIEQRLGVLARDHQPGRPPLKVYILGRYRKDVAYAPTRYDAAAIELEFITAHASKGLEADHVFLPRVTSEILGFPCRVADDPVLQLAMPGADGFAFSEERRLFYVALTRARRTVTLLTIEGKESPFVTELIKDFGLPVFNADGAETASEVCPTCGKGFVVPRKGPYGAFFGCSSFPRCRFTRQAADAERPSIEPSTGRSQRDRRR